MAENQKNLDCVVCGSCVVDILCRPVSLTRPIGEGVLHEVEPIVLAGGGIVSNAGITMARLGMNVGAFTYVGDDGWAPVVRQLYQNESVHTAGLLTHETEATSTTVVAIDPSGERSFLHCVGAPRTMNKATFLDHLELFARSRMALVGYYSLMPNLEPDLPEVLAELRKVGCQTALDAAGDGGSMQPLERILPELDIYVPSLAEAEHQTGLADPEKIIEHYRACGAPGILGVKLGKEGVLLSPEAGQILRIEICTPPGEVVDTTGAGDSFYGGFLSGLLKGMSVEDAGKLGAAAAACCVTTLGGCNGGRDYSFTRKLAGLASD